MKNYRGTVVLLVVLAGLAALVYAFELRGDAAATPTKPALPVVWTVPEEQIVSLEASDDAGQRTVLTKDAAGIWQLTAPEAGPADEWQLNSLLYSLADLQADTKLADGDYDLAPYGLDRPRLKLSLRLAGGQEESIVVGAANPRGTGSYAARASGGPLYLLNTSLVSQVEDLLANPPLLVPTPGPEGTAAPTGKP